MGDYLNFLNQLLLTSSCEDNGPPTTVTSIYVFILKH